jgi:hypothetical protein
MIYRSLLLSSLFMSLISLPIVAQAQSHNTMQAFYLANESVRKCYGEKNLEECSKLDKINSTVIDWCVQGDQEACVLLGQIQQMISTEYLRQI